MSKPYGIRLLVSGPYACFTRPEAKGERYTYDVLTPSAARGILEAVYWKPAIRWNVDVIHVLNPIVHQSIRRNEVGKKASADLAGIGMGRQSVSGLGIRVDEDRQQRGAIVLRDVAYVIEAHFELTEKAGPGDNAGKHLDMFNRRAARGGCFHQPCLGTREFAASFELIAPGVPVPESINDTKELGLMLFDIDHALPGRPSVFFRARLENGKMRIPSPYSAEVLR